MNCIIVASDGEIGRCVDCVVNGRSRPIRYLVVDTRNWLPGRKVLLAPRWLEAVQWIDETVVVKFDSEAIKHGPACDPDQPIDGQFETALCDHYAQSYHRE